MIRAPEFLSQFALSLFRRSSRNFWEESNEILLSCSCRRSALSCIGHISAARVSTAAQRTASSPALSASTTPAPRESLKRARVVKAENPAFELTSLLSAKNLASGSFTLAVKSAEIAISMSF